MICQANDVALSFCVTLCTLPFDFLPGDSKCGVVYPRPLMNILRCVSLSCVPQFSFKVILVLRPARELKSTPPSCWTHERVTREVTDSIGFLKIEVQILACACMFCVLPKSRRLTPCSNGTMGW